MHREEINLRKENQVFLNGEVVKENVVLRTKTKTLTDSVNITANIKPIHDCRAARWWEKPCITQDHITNQAC